MLRITRAGSSIARGRAISRSAAQAIEQLGDSGAFDRGRAVGQPFVQLVEIDEPGQLLAFARLASMGQKKLLPRGFSSGLSAGTSIRTP